MIDVGRDNGSASSYFAANQFGCDVALDSQLGIVHIFAYCHILHFRRDNTGFGVSHLCDFFAWLSLEWFVLYGETDGVERMIVATHATILRGYVVEFINIASICNPFFAKAWNALVDVDFLIRVGVRPACVVNEHRFVRCFNSCVSFVVNIWRKIDFAHTHIDREQRTFEIYLF